jgi:rare lipoprotein A (peptidoglycan hydrolase)
LRALLALLLFAIAGTACGHTRPAPLPSQSGSRLGSTRPSHDAPSVSGGSKGGISYYADSLAGNKMANGKPYQPSEATCAHRSYPFGTRLRIEVDGATAHCTVTDRGPFVSGRILDVSKAVARQLGLIAKGVATGTITVEP